MVLALLAVMLVGMAPTAEAAISTIRPGSTGPDVVTWQYDLNFWLAHGGTQRVYGCSNWITAIRVDGDFGNQTAFVTSAFQYVYDLVPDVVVGPQTRGKMCSFLNHWAGSNKQALSLWFRTC
jgi:peptidoglycan hydrolase-like protein with peptidoglycan-binding domain